MKHQVKVAPWQSAADKRRAVKSRRNVIERQNGSGQLCPVLSTGVARRDGGQRSEG